MAKRSTAALRQAINMQAPPELEGVAQLAPGTLVWYAQPLRESQAIGMVVSVGRRWAHVLPAAGAKLTLVRLERWRIRGDRRQPLRKRASIVRGMRERARKWGAERRALRALRDVRASMRASYLAAGEGAGHD